MAVASYFDTVQKLYIAFYQRPADAGGLYYWSQVLEANNGNLSAVIDAFATSEEAVRLYDTDGNGMIDNADTSALLDSVFQALFNRAPDAAGKQFYLDALTAGQFPDGRVATVGRVVLDVLNGAQNSDAVAIQNKLEYATAFTKTLDPEQDGIGPFSATYNGDDEAGARMLLAAVTSDPATRKTATQVTVDVRDNIANAGDAILTQAVAGQNYTLTIDPNSLVGTGGDDNFIAATNGFLQAFDTVTGGAGNDSLVLGQNGAGVLDADFAGVRSVEILRVTNGTAGSIYNLGANASAAGITTVNVQGAAQIVETNGFVTALTVNGTANGDTANVNLANAGAKTLNLGAGTDTVNVTHGATAAAGSVQVNFTSGAVGNGTDSNVTIVNAAGNVVVNDEGTLIKSFNNTNVFNVVGLAADGTVDPAQNRGNFAQVALLNSTADGTSAAPVLTSAQGTGNVYINAGAGDDFLSADSAGNHFLVGGAGNDSITVSSIGNTSVIAGGGDDTVNVTNTVGSVNINLTSGTNTVTFASGALLGGAAVTADVVAGGTGADTLRAVSTDLTGYVTPATRTISGIETLAVTNQLAAATLTVANVQQGINTVTLERGAANTATVAFEAGSKTINVGAATNTGLGYTAATTDQLTTGFVTSAAGSATTDALALNNANPTASNAFNGANLTATGFETVVINSGTSATATQQTVGIVVLRGAATTTDGGAAAANTDALALTVTGNNRVQLGTISANTAGVVTVDASALVAAAAGTVTFQNGALTIQQSTSTTLGRAVVNGSAGDDSINGSAGNDMLNGAAGADSLDGGALNDTLDGGAGNDVLTGGAGDDLFLITAGTDTVTDLATGDSFQVSAGATANLTTSGAFTATVLTANAGTAAITAGGPHAINLSLAGGPNGYTVNGTDAVADTIVGSSLNDTITGNDGADTITAGGGSDRIVLTETNAAADVVILNLADIAGGAIDTIVGFAAGAGADVLRLTNGLGAGDANGTIANEDVSGATNTFNVSSELVVFDTAITGTLTTASAAAIIGTASTGTYAAGDVRLFVVGNGTDSAVFRFVSTGADALVSAAELTQVVTLTGVAQTAITTGDILFA